MSEFPVASTNRLDEPSFPDADLRAELASPYEIHANTLAVIEAGNFHSDVDKRIATAVAGGLLFIHQNGITTRETYDAAMASLGALVPIQGEDGRRRIAGKPLSKATEQWITSRLESPEVDMMGPEGAWGSLPLEVRKSILANNPTMFLEMTANCTAACSFCCFADKGAITSKLSFDSVLAIVKEFSDQPPKDNLMANDFFYHGTDPFDAKWKTSGGYELDYTSVIKTYADITGRTRSVGTSTAVPIGEEFRVIWFANQFLLGSNFINGNLRLSRTKANADRVDHIEKVVNGMGIGFTDSRRFFVSNVGEHIALRGNAWTRRPDKKISHWDIMGPNCNDGVVLSPDAVNVRIMQGASPAEPNGELRFKLDENLGDGTHLYSVPVQYIRPDYEQMMYRSNQIHPDTGFWVFKYVNGEQAEPVKYGTIQRYPHRALLRIMAAATLYDFGMRNNGLSLEGVQADFARFFGHDLDIVKAHLSSNENPSMDRALEILGEAGLITTQA